MYASSAEIPLKRRRLTFEINVHAPMDVTQAVLPGMRQRKEGWILNISSATSKRPKGPPFDAGLALAHTTATYGASKAALERFAAGLAAEIYDDNIAVNTLAPVAAVRTPGAATSDPKTVTGRICYSRPLLEELNREVRNLDGT